MNTSFVFFGTGPLAESVLATLVREGFVPSLVVTKPDAPQGRHMQVTAPHIKTWCELKNIPVYQPETLHDLPHDSPLHNQVFDVAIVAGPRIQVWPSVGVRVLSALCAEMGLTVGIFGGPSIQVKGVLPLPGTGGLVLVQDPQERVHRIRAKAVVRMTLDSGLPNPFQGWLSPAVIPIQTAYRLLKPNGWVGIEVPNIASPEARWFGADWYHLAVPVHLYHFSPKTLRQMLQRTGFEITSVKSTYSNVAFTNAVSARFPSPPFIKRLVSIVARNSPYGLRVFAVKR